MLRLVRRALRALMLGMMCFTIFIVSMTFAIRYDVVPQERFPETTVALEELDESLVLLGRAIQWRLGTRD